MIRTLTPLLTALLFAAAPIAHAADSMPKTAEAAPTAKAKTVKSKTSTSTKPEVVEEKVVYHVNDAANARAAMRNAQNHISASPGAKIVLVTHGKGIDFLLNDAKDEKGEPYQPQVVGLKEKGVEFRVCRNTLKSRNMDDSAVILDASVVPSGVAEIGKLQSKEGFVYLKP